MNILITGGKNAKVFKLLKAFNHSFVVFGDYDEMPAISTASYCFANLGKKNTQSIAHVLLNFCLSESIDVLIPTYNFEIEQMAKAVQLFAEYNIEVLLPAMDELEIYLRETNFINPAFIVVKKGEWLFSSTGNTAQKLQNNLSGVFEVEAETQKLKLFLV
ncbi:hypothetical protein ABIB40_002500 [Pedobacter sp. UYP30]|uniref:hypothetical protein n=1 Tax=Pedobacter sp. UYP30 TaxID=1756400 RepID=UPI003395C5DC